LIDFATFGRAQQNELNICWRSKDAQVGNTTLFYSWSGNAPVKNYHSFYEILSGLTPLSKYNPKASLSTLNREQARLLKIILFK
jgi:hypothetical protein